MDPVNKQESKWHYYSHHPVWSKVIAGIILAILGAVYITIKGLIQELSWNEIANSISTYWNGNTNISNKIIIVAIAVITIPIIAIIVSYFPSKNSRANLFTDLKEGVKEGFKNALELLPLPLEVGRKIIEKISTKEVKEVESLSHSPSPDKSTISESETHRDSTRLDDVQPTLVATPSKNEEKKTIKDYFSGSWSAVFKVNGKIEFRVIHVDYQRGEYMWFENGKPIFQILGFAVKKNKNNNTILEFHKWKWGNRIECVYTVHNDNLITGDEKNDRWGNMDITLKKIL